MDNDFIFDIDELMNEGRFEEAINKIQELDEDELSGELIFMLAHCLSQCRRYRETLKVLEKVADDISEDDLSYHLEIAGANYGLHKYRTAIKEADRCIEIDENCVEAWILLCLIYNETGKSAEFEKASCVAKEIDEEAWDNIFGDRTRELAVYDEKEMSEVLRYIKNNYGDVAVFLPDLRYESVNYEHPIKIAVIPPDNQCSFFKLVTIGMGAYRGVEVTDSGIENIHRTELVAYIPLSGEYDDDVDIHIWVSRIMRQMGEMVQYENSWFDYGHTVAYGGSLDESVEYDGVIFAPIVNDECCVLPCGDSVDFLLMVPLYEEEMLFKIDNGFTELFEEVEKVLGNNFYFVTKERKNIFEGSLKKKWALPRSTMEDMLDWDGADGCYATDRITVDNLRVGIMYRENPESRFDSGWRFLAGDEDEEYMNNIENTEIFSLNTICNYDPEIIEYLESPIGSAFYRNKSGEFRPMEFRSK